MRLEPLYRLRFTYPEEWAVRIRNDEPSEAHFFFIAEGRAEGKISGRYRAANHPMRRSDGTFLPDAHGVIETDDGAVIYCQTSGFGRANPAGIREVVVAKTHVSDDERYRWLNDHLVVGTGEVRYDAATGTVELVIDFADVIWEPIPN